MTPANRWPCPTHNRIVHGNMMARARSTSRHRSNSSLVVKYAREKTPQGFRFFLVHVYKKENQKYRKRIQHEWEHFPGFLSMFPHPTLARCPGRSEWAVQDESLAAGRSPRVVALAPTAGSDTAA